MSSAIMLIRKDARLASPALVPLLAVCIVTWLAWVFFPLIAWMPGQGTRAHRLELMRWFLAAAALVGPCWSAILIVHGDRLRGARWLASALPLRAGLRTFSQLVVAMAAALVFVVLSWGNAWLLAGAWDVTLQPQALLTPAVLAACGACVGLVGATMCSRWYSAVLVGGSMTLAGVGASLVAWWALFWMPHAIFGYASVGLPAEVFGSDERAYVVDRLAEQAQPVALLLSALAACTLPMWWPRVRRDCRRVWATAKATGVLAILGLACGATASTAVALHNAPYMAARAARTEWESYQAWLNALTPQEVVAEALVDSWGPGCLTAHDLSRLAHAGSIEDIQSLGSWTSARWRWGWRSQALQQRFASVVTQPQGADALRRALDQRCDEPLFVLSAEQERDRLATPSLSGESEALRHFQAPLRLLCTTQDPDVRDALIAWVAFWGQVYLPGPETPRVLQLQFDSWHEVVAHAAGILDRMAAIQDGQPAFSRWGEPQRPADWPEEAHCARQVVLKVLQELGP